MYTGMRISIYTVNLVSRDMLSFDIICSEVVERRVEYNAYVSGVKQDFLFVVLFILMYFQDR